MLTETLIYAKIMVTTKIGAIKKEGVGAPSPDWFVFDWHISANRRFLQDYYITITIVMSIGKL